MRSSSRWAVGDVGIRAIAVGWGAFELMEMNNALRAMIFDGVSTQDLRKAAELNGMKTLQQDGVRKILSGKTSIEEILRLTHAQAAESAWGQVGAWNNDERGKRHDRKIDGPGDKQRP